MDVHIICPCPGTPHPDGDTVTLSDRMSLRGGAAIQHLLIAYFQKDGKHRDQSEITGVLTEAYVLHGISAWTCVDAKRQPVPVDEESIDSFILSDFTVAEPIAEAADELYRAAVIDPLVKRALASLPVTPTNDSTSPTSPTSETHQRRPSKRSSTTTSPTAGIDPTSPSPNGASNLSQSLELVGG